MEMIDAIFATHLINSNTMTENVQKLISENFKNKLCNVTRVKDITPHWTSVVTARSSESISDVFRRMIDKGILALPLFDEETNRYVTFIDVFDILAYIVEVLGVPLDKNEEWALRKEFLTTKCTVLPNRSMRNPWAVINENASVQTAINIMSQTNLTRLAVTDQEGHLTSVLTQTRLVRYLSNRTNEIGPIANIPIERLGLGNNPVIGIKHTEPAINAFLKIYQYNIGGVAVFNDEDKIIGNISISDLKDVGFSLDMFRKMFVKAKQFLYRKIEGADVPRVVWVSKKSDITEILIKFRQHWIHRIYMLDPNTRKAVDVISASDMISVFDSDNPPIVFAEGETPPERNMPMTSYTIYSMSSEQINQNDFTAGMREFSGPFIEEQGEHEKVT